MLRNVPGLLACFLIFSACLSAAEIKGKIIGPIRSARFPARKLRPLTGSAWLRRPLPRANGSFQLDAPETPDTRLVVAAPGFLTRTLPPGEAASVQLEIAPRVDSVQVVGSTIEVPATLQASSVDVIPSSRVRSAQ